MNLIAAEVIEGSSTGAVVKTGSGESVRVAVEASSARPGDVVHLGVRPEHLSLSAVGDVIATRAAFVETLGAATYVYVSHAGSTETLTAQLPGDLRPAIGETLALRVPPDRAYLFDAQGTAFRRLTPSVGPLP